MASLHRHKRSQPNASHDTPQYTAGSPWWGCGAGIPPDKSSDRHSRHHSSLQLRKMQLLQWPFVLLWCCFCDLVDNSINLRLVNYQQLSNIVLLGFHSNNYTLELYTIRKIWIYILSQHGAQLKLCPSVFICSFPVLRLNLTSPHQRSPILGVLCRGSTLGK